ncbi:hypothetical protein ACTFIU_009559 [Dictyostelium citrinum]
MESILDFNQPLNISILDQLLLQQHDPKVSAILNQFIQNPLALSRVDDLLRSNNSDNIRFFGLTVLENNVIKKQLSLNQQQKETIIKQLMEMVLNNEVDSKILSTTTTPSLKGLLRKKSASIIAQILVKEWSESNTANSNLKFVENYISQLLEFIDNSNNSSQMIQSVFNVFKNLASSVVQQNQQQQNQQQQQQSQQQNVENEKLINSEVIFNSIFTKSMSLLQKQHNNSTSTTNQLVIEILNTIISMWDLISLDYLFQGNTLLYLVNGIDCENLSTRILFIDSLKEHIIILISKGKKIQQQQQQQQQQKQVQEFNNKISELIPNLFKIIVEKCSKYINSNKGLGTSLFENIAELFTLYLENYLIVFEGLGGSSSDISQVFLYAEKFIIQVLPSLSSDSSVLCLEYLNILCKSFQQQPQRLSIHTQHIPLLFNTIFEILNKHNEEDLEDGGKGILYDHNSENNNNNNNTNSNNNNNNNNDNDDNNNSAEEWFKISKLLSEILESIGIIYFNDSFQYYQEKLSTMISNRLIEGENASKLGSIFWCLGYLCKSSNQFEKISLFISQLVQNGANTNENIMMGLLFIIRKSMKYLQTKENTQAIRSILEFLTNQLSLSNGIVKSSNTTSDSPLIEMIIQTINIIITTRDQLIQSLDFPNYYQLLNQIVLSNQQQSILSPHQINELYECIGKLLFIQFGNNNNSVNNNELLIVLQPIIEKLKSSKLINDSDRNSINNSLNNNISLAKTMKHLFKYQMIQLSPILIDLFNWSNQPSNNTPSNSGSIFSFKKNIIDIVDLYIKQQPLQQSNQSLESLQNEISKYSELIYNDPTIKSQVYKVDVLPKTLSLIITIVSTFKNQLQKQLIDYLFTPFFTLSIQEAAQQSSGSKGLNLLNRIWELVHSVELNNPILLVDKILNYIELINFCIGNISPSIHGSAIDSLTDYFTNIRFVSNDVVSQIFNFDLVLKETDITLNLLLKSDYQSSIDKIIKLLFVIIQLTNLNEDLKKRSIILFKEKFSSISSIDIILQQIFNVSNTFEMFEKYVKPICKQ